MSDLALWVGMDIASIALVLAFTIRFITKKYDWLFALIGTLSIIVIIVGLYFDAKNDAPVIQDQLTNTQKAQLIKVKTAKNVFIGVLAFYIVWSFGSHYVIVSRKD